MPTAVDISSALWSSRPHTYAFLLQPHKSDPVSSKFINTKEYNNCQLAFGRLATEQHYLPRFTLKNACITRHPMCPFATTSCLRRWDEGGGAASSYLKSRKSIRHDRVLAYLNYVRASIRLCIYRFITTHVRYIWAIIKRSTYECTTSERIGVENAVFDFVPASSQPRDP